MEEQIEKPKKQHAGAAIIIAGILIAGAIIFSATRQDNQRAPVNQQPSEEEIQEVPQDVLVVREDDFVLGNPETASLILFEYSDSDCPFCSRFHTTIKELREQYKDQIAFVYRFYPIDQLHPNARTEAAALACVGSLAGNDSFWNYLDDVMSVTLTPSSNLSVLTTFAREESIDSETFESCVKSGTYSERIQRDVQEALRIGARGTPYSILVNKQGEQFVIPGALPREQMQGIIEGLIQ